MIKKLKNKINKNKGVTIIELLIVIAIIAILASFSASSFVNNIADYRLNAAARELVSNMQWTKINAIKENKEWALVFDVTNSTYCVCSDKGSDGDWDQIADNTLEKSVNLIDSGHSIFYGHGNADNPKGSSFGDEVTFSSNTVVFNQDGTIDPPSGYVYIENCQGNTYAIGGLSSGVVLLYKWEKSQWVE